MVLGREKGTPGGNAAAGGNVMDTGKSMTPHPESSSSTSNTSSPASLPPPTRGDGAPGGSVCSALTAYSSTSSSSSSSSSTGSASERISHEQPVIKRQRIEHDRGSSNSRGSVTIATSGTAHGSNGHTKITTTTPSGSIAAGVATPASSSGASSACSSSTSLSSSPPSCSSTKLIPSSLEQSSDDEQHLPGHHHAGQSHRRLDYTQQHQQHQQQQLQQQQTPQQSVPATLTFQEALGRQCLCTIDVGALLMSFKVPYVRGREDANSVTAIPPLAEWPFEQLLKFLSSVQLLFDAYLKQNIKGNICAGVMDLCNYLIRSDHQHQQHNHQQQHHHQQQQQQQQQQLHLHHRRWQNHQHPRRWRMGDQEIVVGALDIDELIGLCSHRSKYIAYLAGRILASLLIIVKDDPDDDGRWLEKLVGNLFDFSQLDVPAVRKINFSLEVIKRIVEWKDETEHPLDEEAAGNGSPGTLPAGGGVGGSTLPPIGGPVEPPPLADNYFATHFGSPQRDEVDASSRSASIFFPAGSSSVLGLESASSSASSMIPKHGTSGSTAAASSQEGAAIEEEMVAGSSNLLQNHHHHPQHHQQHQHHHHQEQLHHHHHQLTSSASGSTGSCRYITLTDSESFDTTRIKFETINILGGRWSALVKHISSLVRAQANSSNVTVMVATETCILTFLRLWESIISVKANLSVVETQPFHSQLDSFQLLLLVTKNCVIYRQMLTLFNEALCYGSTLALQDLIPEEVGSLAHNIVRSVKDYRILDKMPKSTYSNHLGLLGYKGEVVRYQNRRLSRQQQQQQEDGDGTTGAVASRSETCYDRTLLQKMALLVLKAVAVIVKEIRCDSSDSSVDSSDFDMQEIQMIERSIRDVVRKLETFLKAQLEFHPESHLSKVLIHLFDDQDDYLVEAMVCTLDVTSGISFRNGAFPELIAMLNPVYTFIEFSNLGPNITHLFLDLLISPETCFLLFLLRFLKYIRQNWSMFTQSCYNYYRHNSYSNAATLLQNRLRLAASSGIVLDGGGAAGTSASAGAGTISVGGSGGVVAPAGGAANSNVILDSVMTVLISLRMQISRLVADTLFPYNITPILRLIENCESLYEGNELS
ncbi:protein lines [Anopheles aquasalis]|uniref:protein lines n=1 Tax=Anopheles aquasalis TaxID=42839 RepID=UPI00215AF6B7|nr:protein lines [Anopheles aquasalis]